MASHDECVAQWVRAYKGAGWAVCADIPGYQKPPTIGYRIPDIYATRDSQVNIIEVETDETINSKQAKEQIAAFTSWASQSPTRRFRLCLANAKGCKEVYI